MAFTLNVDGVVPLLLEDGATDIMLENGSDLLTLEGLTDISAALLYGSITEKRNTIDYSIIDYPAPALGATVTTTDPAWSGTVAATTTLDPVDLINGHVVTTVTATNTKALPNDTAPFDLSDTPSVTPPFDYLLEDGTGHYLLESGTDFAAVTSSLMLEGTLSYGYSRLSVRRTAGTPPTTLGQCIVYQPGLRAGNNVHITNQNQGFNNAAYQINQATITWAGANPPVPQYLIEFGDTPQTLAAWTLAHAAPVVPVIAPPLLFPPGITIWGKAAVGPSMPTMGGGIVTIATATFTVTPDPGHTLTCQVQGALDAIAYAWDNYIAAPRRAVRATLSGGIYTGAWQEYAWGWSGGPTTGYRATLDLSSASGLALAGGTYTVTIDIDTQEFNQLQIFSGWVQVAVKEV